MDVEKKPYLKKEEGKLASDSHGITVFAKKRKEKIINEQLEREKTSKNELIEENYRWVTQMTWES